ncbi:hypothetical protein OQA88_466 [Cercophora sp. LCS_1]
MAPFPATVHPYPSAKPDASTTYAYEYSPSPSPARNALIFIGGLGDGPHGVPYLRAIHSKLVATEGLDFTVFEIRLTSAYSAFGYGSLARDVADIAALVRYLRETLGKDKIVLMGHSTGCQDCMEYADYEKYGNPRVDGYILQGPVSDREALGMTTDKEELGRSVAYAEELVKSGKGEEVVPREMLPDGWREAPVSAYRWWSLAGVGGDDDYFSSDLPDERVAAIWGRIEQPVLIVPSGAEEYTPASIDVAKLVNRWKSFCKPQVASELSGLIPGANHRVDNDEGQKWLAGRVSAKKAWRGCGSHIPTVFANVPEDQWCTCEPKTEVNGKKYPPMAKLNVGLPSWMTSWMGGGSSNKTSEDTAQK